MRFGIGMNTDHTLEEVGQQFSVTRAHPPNRGQGTGLPSTRADQGCSGASSIIDVPGRATSTNAIIIGRVQQQKFDSPAGATSAWGHSQPKPNIPRQ